MSTPPPPPYLSAPGPGGPDFLSPGSGPTPGPPGGLTPGVAPPERSRVRFVVIALVLAVIAVGVVFWATRSNDASAKQLSGKGKAVHTALQKLVDDADFNSDGESDLSRCPLGRLSKLDELASAEVDVGNIGSGDGTYRVHDTTDTEPQQVQCTEVSADLGSDVSVYALLYAALLDPPRDVDGYLQDLIGSEGSNSPTVADPVPFEGGMIHRACDGNDVIETCYAVWADAPNKVAISMGVAGGASESEVTKALQAVLPTIIDNLSAAA